MSLQNCSLAGIAQFGEQLFCNQQVAGSSPVASSSLQEGEMAERSKAADCKSAGPCPTKVRILLSPPVGEQRAGVTQLVESQPSKLLVAGSSPVSRSKSFFVPRSSLS